MKPRNAAEREVVQLSHTLSIRKSDMEWIERRHTIGATEYFVIYERKGDWQVIRMFMYRSFSKRREVLHEPLRYWIRRDGKSVIEAKNRQCLGNCYIDAWSIGSPLALRSCVGNRDVRLLCSDHVRIYSLLPELKRMGFRADNICVKNLMPFHLVSSLLTNNRIETFFKLHQTWLTWKFYHYDELTEDLWQSIRVALRHGYAFNNKQDTNDWCDMIRMMHRCGADTHNPKLICPADLKAAHDHWMMIDNRLRNIRIAEERRTKAEDYEPIFHAMREQFLDMVLTDGEIVIKAIPTAKGIIEEGVAMHHCVGGYYDRTASLILSATIAGKRVETIEVNLNTYTLVQSRGLQNQDTKYHDRIVALVNANLDIIRVLDVNHKDVERRKLRKLKKAS